MLKSYPPRCWYEAVELRKVIWPQTSWMRLVPLQKRPCRAPSPLRPREHTARRGVSEPGSRVLPGTECVSTLILDFPASRTVRNVGLCFKPPSLGLVCCSSPKRLRQEGSVSMVHGCFHLQLRSGILLLATVDSSCTVR